MPYYEENGITIYHGDCLDVIPSLSKVSAIITDPPYAVPTQVAQTREITRNAGDLSIAETAYRVHANAWAKTITPDGRVFVCCDGASYPSLYRAMFSQFNLALLIWNKGQIGMGREFRKSHELIVHAWRGDTPIFADGIGRADILLHPPVASQNRLHPAEKPTSLIADLLRVSGETILDPFMGSGTTLVAAKRLGRGAIGIEIEERYCEIAAKRLSQQVLQFTHEEQTEGLRSGLLAEMEGKESPRETPSVRTLFGSVSTSRGTAEMFEMPDADLPAMQGALCL